MRKALLTAIIALLFVTVKAQYTSPTVIATAGDYFSTPNVSLSWTLGEIVTETFTGTTTTLTQGFQQSSKIPAITGVLSYKNTLNTPISGTMVYLKTLAGVKVDSAITLNNGRFNFYETLPGTYVFGLKVTKTWGGVNATDALLVLKHFVMITALTDLYKVAANVDNSPAINSIDALMISKRFTGLISSFIVSDWLYKADTIILGATALTHDLKAICAGDCNGSYIPPLKSVKNVDLITEGKLNGEAGKDISIPITATEKISLGAVSLVLNIEDPTVGVRKVEMPSNEGLLHYNFTGNQLRISWYSTKPLSVEKDSPVFVITLTSSQQNRNPEVAMPFTCTNESEIADADGKIFSEVLWSVPAIQYGGINFNQEFLGIQPNPVISNTQFVYSLNEGAEVGFTVYNTLGAEVCIIPAEYHPAGLNSYSFNGRYLEQGIYLVKLQINGQQGMKFETRHMVVTR